MIQQPLFVLLCGDDLLHFKFSRNHILDPSIFIAKESRRKKRTEPHFFESHFLNLIPERKSQLLLHTWHLKMGKAKKSTIKFQKKHLKETIERRRQHSKVKKKIAQRKERQKLRETQIGDSGTHNLCKKVLATWSILKLLCREEQEQRQ